jgi:hypothetical protein
MYLPESDDGPTSTGYGRVIDQSKEARKSDEVLC